MIVAFVKKKRSQIVAFKIRKIIHIHIYELCFSLGLSGKQKKTTSRALSERPEKERLNSGQKSLVR